MKIILKPSVVCVGRTVSMDHPEYKLPQDGSQAERVMAMGGKVCYDSYGEEGNPVSSHVTNLIKQQHLSVLEHASCSLLITGISRGLSHELVRHRVGLSPSQRSTRYTAEEDACVVLEPYLAFLYEMTEANNPPLDDNETLALGQSLGAAKASIGAYGRIEAALEILAPQELNKRDARKWARGKARQSLPHSLETRMLLTGNYRAWRNMLLLRTNRGAEPEIRRLAQMIYRVIRPFAPAAFAFLTETMVGSHRHGEVFIELKEELPSQ